MLLSVTYHRILQCIVLVLLLAGGSAHGESLETIIEELLQLAQADLEEDRLTAPLNQNAHDRYQAVLLLDKGNQVALLGLRAIGDRYLQFAKAAADQYDFANARRYQGLAVMVNGRSAEASDVATYISRAQERARRERPPPPPSPIVVDGVQRVFDLDPDNLRARDQYMVDQLLALGQRVETSHEYVQIYARDDAEGRWIYQQMRNASVNYRLRGNIQRSSRPRVELEPPLD